MKIIIIAVLAASLTACSSGSGLSPACQRAYDSYMRTYKMVVSDGPPASFAAVAADQQMLARALAAFGPAGCPASLKVPVWSPR